MKKAKLICSLMILSFTYCAYLQAKPILYSLELASSSPRKNVLLNNANIKLALYSNGIPKGYHEKLTDDYQTFALDEKYTQFLALEILSVENNEIDNKRKINCSGLAKPGQTKISVSCPR